MKYLFFDLEYATSKGGSIKICEFGYVVTNERFEIIKKGNFIIDPYINRCDWDWRVVKKILTRTVKEYELMPRFDEYYYDIKDLINGADYVLGHSLDGDAKALNDDCQRYELDSIDFDFYDIKKFYMEYKNTKDEISVNNIMKSFNIQGDERAHDAEADAYNTMLDLKAMLDSLELSLEELITLCPNAKDRSENFIVSSLEESRIKREERMKAMFSPIGSNTLKQWSEQKTLFHQFLDNVLPNKECEKTLSGIKFSMSINYEEIHCIQMFNIVQILCNLGAEYVLKASRADIFVKYDSYLEDGTLKECSKSKYVKEAIEKGANIKVIDLNEFLSMINITEEELNNLPMVSFDCLLREDANIKNRKILNRYLKKQTNKIVKKEEFGVTIGDMFGDLLNNLNLATNS